MTHCGPQQGFLGVVELKNHLVLGKTDGYNTLLLSVRFLYWLIYEGMVSATRTGSPKKH